jgi:iron complex transport system ATP-binding protein
MRKMDVEEFMDRDYLTLSGGEKQRVQFARVLAQIGELNTNETKYLFLDEAVSHLDLKHQQKLLDVTKELCRKGVLVICILHDLNLAFSYADRILFMKDGNIAYETFDCSEINTDTIKNIFDVEVKLLQRENQKPVIVF